MSVKEITVLCSPEAKQNILDYFLEAGQHLEEVLSITITNL